MSRELLHTTVAAPSSEADHSPYRPPPSPYDTENNTSAANTDCERLAPSRRTKDISHHIKVIMLLRARSDNRVE